MAVHYYTDDCSYRLPEKRRTTAWLKAVAEELGMKLFKERFRDLDYNVRLLQKIALRPELTKQLGADAGAVMGVVLCTLLSENIEGLEWNTYINGKVETPVLMYGDVCVARPMLLFGKHCCGKITCIA